MPDLSPTPRRIRTPRWIDFRVVLGVMLVFGAACLGTLLFSSAKRTEPYLQLTTTLAAGTRIEADDVRSVSVRLPGSSRARYVARASDVIGKTLNRPIAVGELIPRDALDSTGASTTVSVPLEADAAPALRPGDRVKLWLSTKTCRAVVLLADVAVQDVRDSGSLSDSGQYVVLSLDPPLADRLIAALALPDVSIRAGTLSGPSVAHANDALPPLDGCQPAQDGTTSADGSAA